LILDAKDGRLYAERFTYEEFLAFEESGIDIRKFWLRRHIPRPRGIPSEVLERLPDLTRL
ncbi:MAG: hypothetical protein RMM10_13155, partial [Anaerolineae bacterium]